MKKEKLKLSLGAGKQKTEGFESVDIDPSNNPDYVMDITNLKFDAESIDTIYACHVLEHLENKTKLNHKDFLFNLLCHWNQLLASDGSIIICVPNIEVISKILIENINKTEITNTLIDAIYGGKRNQYDLHYFGFTKATLTDLLIKSGFENIKVSTPFANDESNHKIMNQPISLNLIAYKSKSQMTNLPKNQIKDQLSLQEIADQRLEEIASLHLSIKELRESKIEAQDVHNKVEEELLGICQERLELINQLTTTTNDLHEKLMDKRSIVAKAIDKFKKTDATEN